MVNKEKLFYDRLSRSVYKFHGGLVRRNARPNQCQHISYCAAVKPYNKLAHVDWKLKTYYHNILNCLENKEKRLTAWLFSWDRLFLQLTCFPLVFRRSCNYNSVCFRPSMKPKYHWLLLHDSQFIQMWMLWAHVLGKNIQFHRNYEELGGKNFCLGMFWDEK